MRDSPWQQIWSRKNALRLFHKIRMAITPRLEPTQTRPPPSYFRLLDLPTEIRLQIHDYYLQSLNLPLHPFSHETMLSYWRGATGVITVYDSYYRCFNICKRTLKLLLNLLLVNRQIRVEVEEVFYTRFIFTLPPDLSSAQAIHEFCASNRAQLALRVQNVQVNLSLNYAYSWTSSEMAVYEKWRDALAALVTEFPALRSVGVAIDYSPELPRIIVARPQREMIDVMVSFARIFKSVPTINVSMRFADVDYERYSNFKPISLPLCTELLDEEKLLLRLRDEDKLIWHRVAMHFEEPRSELYSVDGLQARYRRLKTRQQKAEMEVEFLKTLKEDCVR